MEYYYDIAPTKMIRQDSDSFTYSHDNQLPVGAIVQIPVGKKDHFGVIIRQSKKPKFATRPIAKVIYKNPIPGPLIETSLWTADYYSSPLSTVVNLLLPSGIDKKRRERTTPNQLNGKASRSKKVLTKEQAKALKKINTNTGTSLLFGVTGSGKTQIYIEQALKEQKNGRSTTILVPEIALTSQLVSELHTYFPDLVIFHSRMTEAERHLTWERTLNNNEPQITIGPRSALFLPVSSLGAIIIDEAHEPTYKQEKTPRYSALRVARILASKHKAKLILGSATPSIADYYLANKSPEGPVILSERARKNVLPAKRHVVDMTDRNQFRKHRFLSNKLLSALESNGQVLIYHNRRGSASVTLCESCGWTALDESTQTPLTLHIDKNRLINHLTNQSYPIPTHCPNCKQPDIIHKGIGTKLIEEELRSIYPNKKIARFDGDNIASKTLDKLYGQLFSGEVDIIIGTQVVAKGLDLPHLKTVAVIQADAGLAMPDYTSNERTFQLLSQVAGRVGRNQNQTSLIVQTYQKDSPIIKYGIDQDYKSFYKHEIAIRKKTIFPPFTFLLKLTGAYRTEAVAVRNARALASTIRAQYPNVQIFGPAPAFYEQINGKYRWQIVIKSTDREQLKEIVSLMPKSYWQFELDPGSLL